MKINEYNSVLICLLLVLVSCNGQSYPPTNVNAVYVADGSIRVTWEPPVPGAGFVDNYYVTVEGMGDFGYVQPNNRVYQYNNTDPDTRYTIGVRAIEFGRASGSSQTTITTPKAIYRRKGTNTRLEIPKPPGGLSSVKFNGQTIFLLSGDNIINGGSTTNNGVTFSVTSSITVLTIDGLETKHAGYYYIMRQSGGTILGGELLVVTDNPTRPTITASSSSSVLDSSVTLLCSSSSQSKPDNHGLTLTSSWKINGSDVNHDRYSVNGNSLIINHVRLRDKYNVYTCVAHESGPEVSKLSSEESGEFKLTPRYGPQFVRIEGAKARSPIIRGDVYGPVVCRTDCNPDCRLEWRRQGQLLISSRSTSNNELELVDGELPRQREITYTCRVTASFTQQTLERNLTVQVYYPPDIIALRYQSGNGDLPQQFFSNTAKITEGSDFELLVYIDSNPSADVTLLRNLVPIANGVSETSRYYEITLNSVQCNHSGMYDVTVGNYVTRNRSNAIPVRTQFELSVSCAPRRHDSRNRVIRVAENTGETVQLNVTVIANPAPQVQWSDGVTSLPVLKNNIYMYTVRGEVRITKLSDYKKYHANITNTSPSVLTVFFQIRPKGVPEKQMDFRVSRVSYTYVSVEWRPGYNGGIPQYFHIDYMAVGNEWVPESLNISDAGQGELMNYTLLDLNPATDYVIRLNVSNKIGSGLSTKIKVQTLGTSIPQSNLTTMLAVIGVVVSLVVIGIIVVVVVFVIKRTRRHQGLGTKPANDNQNTPRIELQIRNTVSGGMVADNLQEHVYDTANPESKDGGQPGREGDVQGHVYDTTSPEPQGSGYENMAAKGGANQNNEEENKYTLLKQSTGQEHVYDSTIPGPQESGYEDVAAKDENNKYTELSQIRGQEHVYESTRTEQQVGGTTNGREGKEAKGKK